ncbi:tRNA (N6-threonylcarbamoyladenosine(37)-N6)-methyltransferase TrmO, partial [Klebsiella pneumoniae]|nr:tRNA (N6-threonylcarbamoyladenosine(37)-N6)-methyltransferase TrmO [Klebsiella pneumoniae]
QQAPRAARTVSCTPQLAAQLHTLEKHSPHIHAFIREVPAQDPRPAYRKDEQAGKTNDVWLMDFNDRWRVTDSGFEVFA